MNATRQISRRFGRAAGARTRSAAENSITATIMLIHMPILDVVDSVLLFTGLNNNLSAVKGFYAAIPLTTFAPNVILSGLAARHKLRSHEIRVPQHDRTTGEVSIKKWKLLKAAARSFWQTVVFSFQEV